MSRLSGTFRWWPVVAVAAVALILTAALGFAAQSSVSSSSQELLELERAKAIMNHLDTREAELKVDAYRALLNDEITDLPDDLDSVNQALAELDALNVPQPIREQLEAVKPEVNGFSTFIDELVTEAARNDKARQER